MWDVGSDCIRIGCHIGRFIQLCIVCTKKRCKLHRFEGVELVWCKSLGLTEVAVGIVRAESCPVMVSTEIQILTVVLTQSIQCFDALYALIGIIVVIDCLSLIGTAQ